jgi:hypothetical protein
MEKQKQVEEIREAAKEFAKEGYPVFECSGKKPLVKGWPKITHTSEEEIDSWNLNTDFPAYGMPLGLASGIIRIDVDGDEGREYFRKHFKDNLSETVTFETPGGGLGMLYLVPDGVNPKKYVKSFSGEHNELAFLGTGQFTILPHSVHPNGGIYEWLPGKSPHEIDIAEAPIEIIEMMTQKSNSNTKTSGLVKLAELNQSTTDYQLRKIAEKCQCFEEALKIQQKEGLDENTWFLNISLLVATENDALAFAFSKKSQKHNKRSEERIGKLIQERDSSDTDTTYIKCITFGCRAKQIGRCFSKVIRDKDNDKIILNSPWVFIENVTRITPSTLEIYKDYLAQLKYINNYYLDRKGNLCTLSVNGKKIEISNFILRIIKEIVKTDGINEEKSIIVEGVLEGGEYLKPVEVKLGEFEKFEWLIKAWGIRPIIHSGQGYKDAIRDITQSVSKSVKKDSVYNHIGWHKLEDGKLSYLHYGGAIGADNIKVELEPSLKQYELPQDIKDIKKGIKMSLKILRVAPKDITIPMLAMVYLSPLVHFFLEAELSPNFILWLFGITGSRKTAIALVLLSHFGDFVYKSPPTSFKDTANKIERAAHCAKDSLLLVDDYHPNASEAEASNMAKILERVLRMFGDRIGRGRLTATLNSQTVFAPRGMGIGTGEDIGSGESSVARYIGLEVIKKEVDLEILTELQSNSQLLRESMRGYIEWLLPQASELPKRLNAEFYKLRSKYQQYDVHGRTIDAVAYLQIAFNLFLQYAVDSEAITLEYKEKIAKISRIKFKKLIAKQAEKIQDQKIELVFTVALKELVDIGKASLQNINKPEDSNEIIGSGEFIGYYDDEFYYLYPQVTYNFINKFLSGSKKRLSVSPKMLWKNLHHAGMIRIEGPNTENAQNLPKKTIKVNGETKRTRLLHLYRKCLDE